MNIQKRLSEALEQKHGLQTICNTMSVATYMEGIQLLIRGIGRPEQNPEVWKSIALPLKNWKNENTQINGEIKDGGMSGDSMVDESNTWWAAIQSTICRNS